MRQTDRQRGGRGWGWRDYGWTGGEGRGGGGGEEERKRETCICHVLSYNQFAECDFSTTKLQLIKLYQTNKIKKTKTDKQKQTNKNKNKATNKQKTKQAKISRPFVLQHFSKFQLSYCNLSLFIFSGVFSGYSGFLRSSIGLIVQPIN